MVRLGGRKKKEAVVAKRRKKWWRSRTVERLLRWRFWAMTGDNFFENRTRPLPGGINGPAAMLAQAVS